MCIVDRLFGRRIHVTRKPGERLNDQCVVPTLKYDRGNLMVFLVERTGDFIQVNHSGNHEKRTISFDFSTTFYIIYMHNCKNIKIE